MDNNLDPRDLLEEQPPSTKLVYKVLDHEGPLTQADISERSHLSSRTVRYSLKKLDEINAVEEEFYFPDARKKQYSLSDEYRDLID